MQLTKYLILLVFLVTFTEALKLHHLDDDDEEARDNLYKTLSTA